jgi:hypothetical protein
MECPSGPGRSVRDRSIPFTERQPKLFAGLPGAFGLSFLMEAAGYHGLVRLGTACPQFGR